MNQSNTLADQIRSRVRHIPDGDLGTVVFAGLVAAVIIGGIRRIGR